MSSDRASFLTSVIDQLNQAASLLASTNAAVRAYPDPEGHIPPLIDRIHAAHMAAIAAARACATIRNQS